MKKEIGLYIHIPFCISKCHYCNFVSKIGDKQEQRRYIDCLKKEIQIRAKEYNGFFTIKTIFIGGGTPSCLEIGVIKEILQTVYKCFTVKNSAEITIELNPNTLTKEKVQEFAISGIIRFSIGLQSTNPSILKKMGRTHNVEDFENAITLIREQGISNISADVILGYPSQTEKDCVETIKFLLDRNIPHISTYMLSVEEGTPLQKLLDNKKLKLPTEERVIKSFNAISTQLDQAGYNHYEVSNFAKPGFTCKHNLIYWNCGEYLGLGLSAHSYIDGTRFSNTENLESYCDCIEKKHKAPVSTVNKLSKAQKKEEYIMLSLRTSKGLSTKLYKSEFGGNFLAEHKDLLTTYIKLGLLIIDKDENVKATQKGFLVLNKIILELCSE